VSEPSITPGLQPVAAAAEPLNHQFLDLPQPPATDDRSLDDRMRELEAIAKLNFSRPPEYTGARRFAWPIDILLYPANTAGLGALAIIVGIPAVMTFLMWFGGPLAMFVGMPFFVVSILIGLYTAWYFAECVYDSARGGVRAPMGLDAGGGTSDMFSRVLNLVAVYVLFIGPAGIYWVWVQRFDGIFFGLVAWAVVFFPMGLLAMVIEDSSAALNPFSLLVAILRTFVPYLGLLVLIGLLAGLKLLISAWLNAEVLSYGGWFLNVMGETAATYLGLVMAHVLGRFYWRYQDRLDWGL
jgi:hypothetical protein